MERFLSICALIDVMRYCSIILKTSYKYRLYKSCVETILQILLESGMVYRNAADRCNELESPYRLYFVIIQLTCTF